MFVLPGRRFGVSSLFAVPRLLRTLAAVFSGEVDYMIDAARDQDWNRHRQHATRWSSRVLDVTETTLEIIGLEHIDPDDSYVVAPLHEGFADVLALMQLPLRLAWAARHELAEWSRLEAFFETGAVLSMSPERPVSAMRTLLMEAPSVFESGRSLVLFPQGTLLGVQAAFSTGAFRVADRFSRSLLPIVITGTHRVYEYPFSPLVRFGETILMQILPPVVPGGALDAFDRVEEEMRELALSAQPGPRRYRPDRDGYWDGYAFEIAPGFAELAADVAAHRRVAAEADAENRGKPAR